MQVLSFFFYQGLQVEELCTQGQRTSQLWARLGTRLECVGNLRVPSSDVGWSVGDPLSSVMVGRAWLDTWYSRRPLEENTKSKAY